MGAAAASGTSRWHGALRLPIPAPHANTIRTAHEPRGEALAVLFPALALLAPAAVHRPRRAVLALHRLALRLEPRAGERVFAVHPGKSHGEHARLLVRTVIVAVRALARAGAALVVPEAHAVELEALGLAAAAG